MNKLFKNVLTLLLVGITLPSFAQNQWIGQLSLSDFDCNNKTACYTLSVKGVGEQSWALGDQNYRFFFDADNISISSVASLLPMEFYSEVQTDEILEIIGQNQEAFSPLDNIDDNLGFLDFNIIAYGKQFPHLVKQINNESFLSVAEICLEISEEMVNNTGEEYAMNLIFSRPLTAGQITNQYSVISEIDEANHTKSTQPVGFLDIEYGAGLEAQLGELCQLLNSTEEPNVLENSRLNFYPNPCPLGEKLIYSSVVMTNDAHEIFIYNSAGQLIKHYPNLPVGNNSIKIEDHMSPGAYFVHLKSEKYQVMKELIVVK